MQTPRLGRDGNAARWRLGAMQLRLWRLDAVLWNGAILTSILEIEMSGRVSPFVGECE